jgi:hypothetical protein
MWLVVGRQRRTGEVVRQTRIRMPVEKGVLFEVEAGLCLAVV